MKLGKILVSKTLLMGKYLIYKDYNFGGNKKMVTKDYSDMELTENEFNEIINNSHKLVVVDFFAEWCMPCLMITPIIEDLAEQLKEVKFTKVNIDDNQKLAQKYEVSSIPCLIIFKDGKEIDRIVGAQSQDNIEEKIREYLD